MQTFSEKRVDFFPVGQGFPNENYWKNGEILREGVEDYSCLYVGKVRENFAPEILTLLINDEEYISSVEFYSNGAMNCFVRYSYSPDEMAHCVIVVRPVTKF